MRLKHTFLIPAKTWAWIGISLLALLNLSGCASICYSDRVPGKEMVVLLPDDQGHVGVIAVATDGGTQELNQAQAATELWDKETSPSEPMALSQDEFLNKFSTALAALPEKPIHFILYFQSGTANLTEESQLLLPKILEEVIVRNSRDVSVVGHTDTAGASGYNYRLSLARAQSVAKILQEKGLDPAHIEITSHGEKNLLVATPDNVSEPRNRRVEVTVR